MALKTAVISPAIAMQQQAPESSDEQRLFEDKFGQMAYTAFSSKYPDLVPDIVTFKILDADLDTGISIGAFILEKEGEYIYIPAILSENELKPFDLMYVKSKDIFLPLDSAWIQEVSKNTVASMGEGAELPSTVPTDVDIRNVMLPPMTGRNSYAHYVGPITEHSKYAAAASEPLGRRLMKLAVGDFPDPNQPPGGQNPAQGGSPGHEGETSFDPNMWAGFIQQFQLTQNMTPGEAIDSGAMDLDAMSKMFKTHQKAWSTPELPTQQQAAAEAQAQQPQPQVAPAGMPPPAPQQQGMTATASWHKEASRIPGVKTIGEKIDDAIHHAVRSGAVGGLTGGVIAASDGDYRDMPSSMVRGAMGGAMLGPIGHMLGEETYAHFPEAVNLDKSRKAGRAIGAMLGGAVGAKSETHPPPAAPEGPQGRGMFSRASALVMPPVFNMMTTASDHSAGMKNMIKHAQASSEYTPYLPSFLYESPNRIKRAFIQVLDENPRLLKRAVDLYGVKTLQSCLRQVKTAGITHTKADLRVADADTKPGAYRDYFGEGAVTAYQSVLKRGYYYEDTRPGLKTAVQVQEYHDLQNTLDAGVYRLFTTKGAPEGALVLVEPLNLFDNDRPTFPHDHKTRVKPLHLRVRDHMPDEKDPVTEKNHKYTRMAILEDGSYFITTLLYGEQVTEGYLKGTALHRALREQDRKPRSGRGCFIGRAGSGWVGTLPLNIQDVTQGSDGTIRGKMTDQDGWDSRRFVIDPAARTSRPLRPESGAVIIPAAWRWVPLGQKMDEGDLITDPRALQRLVLDKFTNYNAVKLATVRADQGRFVVEREALRPAEALQKIATVHHVHASAAEAMMKIAQEYGQCRAYIVPRDVLQHVHQSVKIAQGMPPQGMAPAPAPQVPPGPPQPMPPGQPGMAAGAEGAMPGAPAQDPAAAVPQQPPEPSAVDQAFSESLGGLQQQMQQLQAQLDVLQSVQQRAQQIEMEQSGMMPPMDPSMQGMDPSMQGMDPSMPQGMDPSMQGMAMDPSMGGMQPGMQQMDPSVQGMPGQMPAQGMDPSMDPNMQQEDQQLPIMRTEEPSAEEIAQQISPDFLEQAGQLHETGAFDAAGLASLAQNGNLKSITSQYAANLENTIDDLGRTLLTLYMQEPQLKTQLGDETYMELETQLRDTFRGTGKLVLSLTHNSAMLDSDAAP